MTGTGVFVATFAGLGNQFASLPLLRAIVAAMPGVRIYVPATASRFAHSIYAAHLPAGSLDYYPAEWRRFARRDWAAIGDFIVTNRICVVLNWRNEGPTWDSSYFQFKAVDRPEALRFEDAWSAFDDRSTPVAWAELARDVTRQWLPQLTIRSVDRPPRRGKRIDLFTSASTSNKRWREDQWTDLIEQLLERSIAPVGIHLPSDNPGLSEVIRRRSVSWSRVSLFEPFDDVRALLSAIGEAAVCFSLDSFASHLCAVTGTPSVVAFSCTDPRVWGHPQATIVSGAIPLHCDHWKAVSGNCTKYYSGCEPRCLTSSKVDSGQVLEAILHASQTITN